MRYFLTLTFLFIAIIGTAQSKLEMTPQGFAPVEIQTPNKPFEKLLELSKSWANFYNKKGAAVFDVSGNSLSIEALNESAFFYRNLGQRYDYNIKYILKITFLENKKCKLAITVKEIYADEVLTKMSVATFYTPDEKLKTDYTDVKPSLENTVNAIVRSYGNFIAR